MNLLTNLFSARKPTTTFESMVEAKLNEDESEKRNEGDSMLEDGAGSAGGSGGEEEIDSIVDGMNQAAKTKTVLPTLRTSPRLKRAQPSDRLPDSPSKRRAVAADPVETDGTTPAASVLRSKLRPRASLATRHSINRNDLFEMPDERPNGVEAVSNETAPRLFPKNRTLNKKPQPNPSPFKGRGELDIVESGPVNLADASPARKSPRRKRAIPQGKTQTAQRLRGEATPLPRRKARVSGLVNEEDISDRLPDAAAMNEVVPTEKRKQGRPLGSKNKTPSKTQLVEQNSRPVPQLEPPEQEPAPNSAQEPEMDSPREQEVPKQREQKKAVQNKDSQQKQPPRKVVREQVDSSQNSPELQIRPERAIARKGHEDSDDKSEKLRNSKAEYIRELREAGYELMGDMAPAAAVYDLSKHWAEVFAEAASIIDDRAKARPSSRNGKSLTTLMKRRRELYDALGSGEQFTTDEIEENLARNMHKFDERLTATNPVKDRQEDLDTVRDIYEHVIPVLLNTLQILLGARYIDSEFSLESHQDLVQLLSVTLKTIEKGQKWPRRPEFSHKLPSRMIGIKLNIKALKDSFQRQLQLLERRHVRRETSEQRAFSPELDEEQIEATAKSRREESQKQLDEYYAKLRAKHDQTRRIVAGCSYDQYVQQNEPVATVIESHHMDDDEIFDIDEVDNFDPRNGNHNLNSQMAGDTRRDADIAPESSAFNGTVPKSAFRREQTEEIPGPAPGRWTNAENIALCNGLQEFTSYTRFQDILRVYGEEEGALASRDLDEIISQSKFLKRSLASRLKEELIDSYGWLRSVPD